MVTRSTTPWKPCSSMMGSWTGTTWRPQFSCIARSCAGGPAVAGFGVVHLIDDHDAGKIDLVGVLPDAVGDGLDAVLGVDDDDGGFDGKEGGAGFVGEHVEAGGVDEVDFDAVPLGEGDGVGHGGAAGDLFFVVGGDGGAIFDAARSGSHFGGVQQGGDEGGLAAVRVPDDQLRCECHFPDRSSCGGPLFSQS